MSTAYGLRQKKTVILTMKASWFAIVFLGILLIETCVRAEPKRQDLETCTLRGCRSYLLIRVENVGNDSFDIVARSEGDREGRRVHCDASAEKEQKHIPNIDIPFMILFGKRCGRESNNIRFVYLRNFTPERFVVTLESKGRSITKAGHVKYRAHKPNAPCGPVCQIGEFSIAL